MSLTKVNYVNNQTIIGAQNLNDIQDSIINLQNEVPNKLSMELLWENASPTSECDDLTVDNLDLSIYSHVLIEFMYSTNLQWVIGQLCKVGNLNVIPASMVKNYYRMFSVTTTKIWFEIAHFYNSYGTASTETKTNLIPYRIYGIKGASA